MHLDMSQVTLYLALWGALGPLVGIIVGHVLTRSWQRKQWILDCRKEEFREVTSDLTAATIELMMFIHSQRSHLPQPQTTWLDAHRVATKTLASRIYIAPELKKLDVATRYLQIDEEIRESGASSASLDKMSALMDDIVAVAIKG
jgi:hypothetical protein